MLYQIAAVSRCLSGVGSMAAGPFATVTCKMRIRYVWRRQALRYQLLTMDPRTEGVAMEGRLPLLLAPTPLSGGNGDIVFGFMDTQVCRQPTT